MFAGTPLETKKTVVETVQKADFSNSMPFDEGKSTDEEPEMVDATEEDDDDFFARLANG